MQLIGAIVVCDLTDRRPAVAVSLELRQIFIECEQVDKIFLVKLKSLSLFIFIIATAGDSAYVGAKFHKYVR